jgi:hypothetical protein
MIHTPDGSGEYIGVSDRAVVEEGRYIFALVLIVLQLLDEGEEQQESILAVVFLEAVERTQKFFCHSRFLSLKHMFSS